jgi:ferritin-like metal-binding protein YciE
MQVQTLRDLYVDELRDLYNAENQVVKALPKMSQAASIPELKQAFDMHLQQTQQQIQRLDRIFNKLGESPSGTVCKGMKGIIDEGEELMNESSGALVCDAGLISSAQRVEHYEIAGYGTVRTYAQELGDQEAADLLQQTLDEEAQADKRLSQIAERVANTKAVHA